MNQVILIGRLTRDPELRYIPNTGTPVGRFSLAVNREVKKEGQPDADFFNIVTWGKQAEHCGNYLKKGRLVAITGQLRNNNYTDKNNVKHYGIEVMASRIEFLEWDEKQSSGPNTSQTYSQNKQVEQNDMYGFQPIEGDDDIPF
ncbi:MAG: single-stranded DNA-binding protein [Clostridia bacterium]|nr:single-stranded DNA-binding protein [Clostridia bacterium]